MSKNELGYLKLLDDVLTYGERKHDRTGTGTISLFGAQTRYNLQEGYPLFTTKKINLNKVLAEYLAFINAETNANRIADVYGFGIWKLWADDAGELGPIYGKQWRDWPATFNAGQGIGGIDQLQAVIDSIKNNPDSRCHIVNAWNVGQLDDMRLPPCHVMFQFYVREGKYLDCQLYQRSCDLFLGGPFNVAGYSALTMMIAQLTDLEPGHFIHTIGDAHIYTNHIEQVKDQLKRDPRPLPQLKIEPQKNINDYWFSHFELIGYEPHPAIKGNVSV